VGDPSAATASDPEVAPLQIRSRKRVRDLAEVYTQQREVDAMLDLIPDMFPGADDPANTDRTFLEPACGSGNFLAEILRRKLTFVTATRYGSDGTLEHRILRCLASVYGVDISIDNVHESRARLQEVISSHIAQELSTQPSAALLEAADVILSTNVVCGDTILHAAELELVEYRPEPDGRFIRSWFLLNSEASVLQIPSARPPKRDARPVHYSELARYPGPVK
jgi:SAM-dependent methyltransferase